MIPFLNYHQNTVNNPFNPYLQVPTQFAPLNSYYYWMIPPYSQMGNFPVNPLIEPVGLELSQL